MRKVPDKPLIFEIRLPEKSKDAQLNQDTFAGHTLEQNTSKLSQTHERRQLQQRMLGNNFMLASE